MTASHSCKYKLVGGFSAEFEFNAAAARIDVCWSPRPPVRLSKGLLKTYRAARDHFTAQLAQKLGAGVIVMELTPEMLKDLGDAL